MLELEIGFVLFLCCALWSRVLNERAFRTLDDAQKLALIEAFSGMRKYAMAPVIAIVAVVIALPQAAPDYGRWSAAGGLALLAAYFVAKDVMVRRRLASVDMPDASRRGFLRARYLGQLGLILLLASIVVAAWRR
ncbi:MAG: hypothetical protein GC159_09605 [Phycisphaera sp.]|nr:hypothetical protein [Phycisphaera sp.]